VRVHRITNKKKTICESAPDQQQEEQEQVSECLVADTVRECRCVTQQRKKKNARIRESAPDRRHRESAPVRRTSEFERQERRECAPATEEERKKAHGVNAGQSTKHRSAIEAQECS